MSTREHPQKQIDEQQNSISEQDKFLILYNDDYHTFDYVIKALIEICDHDPEQAEQCTLLVHYKGKCDVKKGSFSYLRPMKNALVKKDLKATID